MSVDRRKIQQLQSVVLDTCTTCAVGTLFYYKPEFFNPWNLSLFQWMLGGLAIRGAINFYDHLVVFAVDSIFNQKFLPTRTTGKPVRYVDLDMQSIIFLSIKAD